MIYGGGCIFVHVPKTGGCAISHALGGKTKEINTHRPLFGVDKGERFAFGFIRNPWDRMVSLYHYLCQKTFKRTDNFDQDEVRAAGFKSWLMGEAFYMQEDYLPTGEPWVVGGKGDLPPMQRRTQMYWLEGCDYIGRFEDLEKEYQTICQKIDIPAKPLSIINTSQHGHYRDYYDAESREFIAYHFSDDVRFGYTF